MFGDLNEGAHKNVSQVEQKFDVTSVDTNIDVEHEAFIVLQKYTHLKSMTRRKSGLVKAADVDREVESLLGRFSFIITSNTSV